MPSAAQVALHIPGHGLTSAIASAIASGEPTIVGPALGPAPGPATAITVPAVAEPPLNTTPLEPEAALELRVSRFSNVQASKTVLRAMLLGVFDAPVTVYRASAPGEPLDIKTKARYPTKVKTGKATGHWYADIILPTGVGFDSLAGQTLQRAFASGYPELECWFTKRISANGYPSSPFIQHPQHALPPKRLTLPSASKREPKRARAQLDEQATTDTRTLAAQIYDGLTLEDVQQRAELYNGLMHNLAILRAFLTGVFDPADVTIRHPVDGRVFKFTESKRTLRPLGDEQPGLLVSMHVPSWGRFRDFGHLTLSQAFALGHPLIDRFLGSHTTQGSNHSRHIIVSTRARALQPAGQVIELPSSQLLLSTAPQPLPSSQLLLPQPLPSSQLLLSTAAQPLSTSQLLLLAPMSGEQQPKQPKQAAGSELRTNNYK